MSFLLSKSFAHKHTNIYTLAPHNLRLLLPIPLQTTHFIIRGHKFHSLSHSLFPFLPMVLAIIKENGNWERNVCIHIYHMDRFTQVNICIYFTHLKLSSNRHVHPTMFGCVMDARCPNFCSISRKLDRDRVFLLLINLTELSLRSNAEDTRHYFYMASGERDNWRFVHSFCWRIYRHSEFLNYLYDDTEKSGTWPFSSKTLSVLIQVTIFSHSQGFCDTGDFQKISLYQHGSNKVHRHQQCKHLLNPIVFAAPTLMPILSYKVISTQIFSSTPEPECETAI